jgi:hypothetical protein
LTVVHVERVNHPERVGDLGHRHIMSITMPSSPLNQLHASVISPSVEQEDVGHVVGGGIQQLVASDVRRCQLAIRSAELAVVTRGRGRRVLCIMDRWSPVKAYSRACAADEESGA